MASILSKERSRYHRSGWSVVATIAPAGASLATTAGSLATPSRLQMESRLASEAEVTHTPSPGERQTTMIGTAAASTEEAHLAAPPRGKIRAPSAPSWDILADAFENIHAQRTLELEFALPFRECYRFALLREGDWLCDQTVRWHRDMLQALWAKQFKGVNQRSEKPLAVFSETWKGYWPAIRMVADVLQPALIRSQKYDEHSFINACVEEFLNSVVHFELSQSQPGSTVLQRMIDVVLDLTYYHPLGVAPLAKIYDLLGLFFRILEGICGERGDNLFDEAVGSVYLEPVRRFYESEAARLVPACSAFEFCNAAKRRMLEEEWRCHNILPPCMGDKVKLLIVETVIRPYINQVLRRDSSGIESLLSNASVRELAIIYETVATAGEEKQGLQLVFRNWIMSSGSNLQPQRDTSSDTAVCGAIPAYAWTMGMMRLERKAEDIVRRAFRSDEKLEADVSLGISNLVRQEGAAQYLSEVLNDELARGRPHRISRRARDYRSLLN
ncbi:hypothetical protein MAPG_00049 [Magnaporthiopsis poae ATCC 64411]|uniref:Cullin N-terminal domain-containing protein n=1 Tax=Magnaporthiopsis poae (strain ATCC 64411 / 73-15) TaxID=644358 RepID=A0A0C4DJY9_MAGP6|nr:hypothetical protein MAPG_00049 [Magnaporthiopsis poae ATCC 64411]